MIRRVQITGLDVYFGQGSEDNDDEESEEDTGVQEYVRARWNLNISFASDPRRAGKEGLRPESFDLINSRFVADGIDTSRWPGYVDDLRKLLRPGTGWLQMAEVELLFQSDNGMLRYDNSEHLFVWQQWYANAMQRIGKDPRAGRRLGAHMRSAGFRDVRERQIRLEIGAWNTSQSSILMCQCDTASQLTVVAASAALGSDIRNNALRHIEAVSLWPVAGAFPGQTPLMPMQQYRTLIDGARSQLRDDRLKLYYTL